MPKIKFFSFVALLATLFIFMGCEMNKTNEFEPDVDADESISKPISGQQYANQFIERLAAKEYSEAVLMMDASEETKAGWLTNFNTLESLKISGVEPVYQDEWTSAREIYKFTLDVQVSPAGEQIGWSDGENFRWITVQKVGGAWTVHELANNP